MPRRHLQSLFALPLGIVSLLLLPKTVSCVSLGDFTPRAANLTETCATIYNSQISGCSNADFTSGTCSSACIHALVVLNTEVYQACSGEAQDDQYIIAAFLNGRGISSICPNVVVTTVSGGGEVTMASISTQYYPTSMSIVTTPAVTSNAITVPQATDVPSSILIDTSSAPKVSPVMFTPNPKITTVTSVVEATSIIRSTIIVAQSTPDSSSTSSTLSSTSPTVSASDLSSSALLGVVTSTVIQTTTHIVSTSITVPAVSRSSSSVASLSTATDCQHSGDPFQYCNSASSLSQSSVYGLLPTAVAIAWILTWLASG